MLHYSVVRGFTLGDYLDKVMVMVVVTGVLPSPPPPEQVPDYYKLARYCSR